MGARGILLTAVLTAAALLADPTGAAAGVAGGIDGDGKADVLARGADGTLWLVAGDGAAPPANPWLSSPPRAVGTGWNLADRMVLGDVTGDGRQDVLAREAALAGGTLWIYRYDGATPFGTRIWAGFGWNIAIALTTGDVTGDGRTDIVTREADGRMWLYPHSGDLTTPYPTRQVIGANWQQTTALLLADVTGDGLLDVVARDRDGSLWIYPRQPARAAAYFDRLSPRGLRADAPYDAGGGWQTLDQLQAADVTGDGRPDMVGRTGGTLRVYPHTGAAAGTNPWPAAYPAGDGWAQYTAVLVA